MLVGASQTRIFAPCRLALAPPALMADLLRDRLQSALGPDYSLERELRSDALFRQKFPPLALGLPA